MKIYFIGGGDIKSGKLKSLDKQIIKDNKIKSILVLNWLTNNKEKSQKYYDFLSVYFKELGVKSVDIVDTKISSKELELLFKKNNLIYLPGGDTELLLKNIFKKKADKLFHKYNKVYVGNSAGAIAFCKNALLTKDEDIKKTKIMKGIGLVDFSVDPHYTKEHDKEIKSISRIDLIYGITECSALVYNNKKLSHIKTVYEFTRKEEKEKSLIGISAIINNKDKILLIKRAKAPWKNMWSTPGGRLEKGETKKQAVIREIKEEINVDLMNVKLFNIYTHIYNNVRCKTYVYTGTIKGKIKIKKDEVLDYKYYTKDQALKLRLASTNRQRIIDYFKKYKKK